MGDTRSARERLNAGQGGRVVMEGAGMTVGSHGIGVNAHRVIRMRERFALSGDLRAEARPPENGSCVYIAREKYLWLDAGDGASRINTASRGETNNFKLVVRAPLSRARPRPRALRKSHRAAPSPRESCVRRDAARPPPFAGRPRTRYRGPGGAPQHQTRCAFSPSRLDAARAAGGGRGAAGRRARPRGRGAAGRRGGGRGRAAAGQRGGGRGRAAVNPPRAALLRRPAFTITQGSSCCSRMGTASLPSAGGRAKPQLARHPRTPTRRLSGVADGQRSG